MKQHEITPLFAKLDVASLKATGEVCAQSTPATAKRDAAMIGGILLAMDAVHAVEAELREEAE